MVHALISFALEKLGRLSEDELKLLCGTREEVDKLSRTLQMIRPCLDNAEARQFHESDVGAWLKMLKYVAYEANDVLDEWQTESQLRSIGANSVWNFFAQCTCFHQLVLSHTVGKKIQKINDKLDDIHTQSEKFNFLRSTNVMGKGIDFPSVIRNARQTNSSVEEIFGREDEIKGIKDKLMNSSEVSELAVLSIVGGAGFGKTTIAKHVFSDGEIVQHFKQRIWVCVSDQFDVTTIMKKMIEAAKRNSSSAGENQEALRKKIADEVLKNKLFLLVLDDVWNEDFGKWENLFNVIKKCGLNGSQILVTTRNENVCKVMGSAHMFKVGIVSSPKHCWSIFESVAFASINESQIPELKMVGEKIVEKCKGVPLAIKTVAGVLRTKNTIKDWENVLKSDMWNWQQPQSGTDILPALLLSYYHLSPQLKQCFRYCAIYPKDYWISKDEIVLQWIAHGYISEKNNMEMEDVGENYFNELIARSLFQEPGLDDYNSITHCKMHDLVHDLALFVTKGEFLFINNETKIEVIDNQYPPLHCTSTDMKLLNNIKIDVEKLRTFRCEIDKRKIGMPNSQIDKMQHLRVLELNGWNLEMLHNIVGKLPGKFLHLRYLNLSRSEFIALPSSIEKLQNLLYLNLSQTLIKTLPEESVGMLRNLRHLDLSHNENLKSLPNTIGRLTNLKKLNLYGTRLNEIPSSIGELQNLSNFNLTGTSIEALPESIGMLRNLRYLDLSWNKNLKALPSTIGRLTNLTILDLHYSTLLESLDCIGKLSSLQFLDVSDCQNLEKLPESINGLSRLQALNISECPKLKQLPAGIFDKMTGLKELKVRDSGLQGLPAGIGKLTDLQILDSFWVLGNHQGASSSSSSSSSSNIWELGGLNHLHGELYIHNLNLVTSGEEAARALLHNKNSLAWLELHWNTYSSGGAKEETTSEDEGDGSSSSSSNIRELGSVGDDGLVAAKEETTSEDVLQALRPCPALGDLWIYGYPGCRVPSWLGNSTAPPMLSRLQGLLLERWDRLTELPALGNLPELRQLEIGRMPKVRRVGAEWFGSNHGFPKLEYLRFWNMAEWEDWDIPFFTFPCLKELDISVCPKLRSLPPILSTSPLRKVDVHNCPNLSHWLGILPPSVVRLGSISAMWVNGMSSLPNLEDLTIRGDYGVTELAGHLVKLSALKELTILNCPNLESLPGEMDSLKQLQKLRIYNCGKLQSLPSLPNLEDLTISGDHGLTEMASLQQLQTLTISNCGKLQSLPSLPNLEHLTISGDDGVSKLSSYLVKLSTLKKLDICNCPNLESLPPEMASLKQLRRLEIKNCPKLKESCNKEGAQWYKIQHIPSITIDDKDVQRNA